MNPLSQGARSGSGVAPAELRQMLDLAKELAQDGTAEGTMRALALVTDMIRETQGGENAVLEALKQAKENHQRVMASNERPGENWVLLRPVGSSQELMAESSLLGEGGRQRVIADAAEDGSSVMCTKCGSLIPKDRLEPHVTTWCPALPDQDDGE